MRGSKLVRTGLALAAIVLLNGCCHKHCWTRPRCCRVPCETAPVIVSPVPDSSTLAPTPMPDYKSQN
jgi:hypothetical protein